MSQINNEMNDALSIFDKSQFTTETATSSGGKGGNSFGESQYEETNSFDSEEAVEDDCSRIVHKGYLSNQEPSTRRTPHFFAGCGGLPRASKLKQYSDYSYSFLNNRDPCAEDENI